MNKINEALLSPHEIEILKEKKMEKTIKDMERNGFMIVKAEKVTTFIYTVIGKKIQ